jgi:hypothetical protein
LNNGGSSDNTAILFCNQKNMYDWTANDKLYGQIIKKAHLQYSIGEENLVISD